MPDQPENAGKNLNRRHRRPNAVTRQTLISAPQSPLIAPEENADIESADFSTERFLKPFIPVFDSLVQNAMSNQKEGFASNERINLANQ